MSLHALDKPRRLVVDEAFLSLLAITLTLVAWKAFAGRFLQRTLVNVARLNFATRVPCDPRRRLVYQPSRTQRGSLPAARGRLIGLRGGRRPSAALLRSSARVAAAS
jgi:hypothetical protein